jgi:hypothetical protein
MNQTVHSVKVPTAAVSVLISTERPFLRLRFQRGNLARRQRSERAELVASNIRPQPVEVAASRSLSFRLLSLICVFSPEMSVRGIVGVKYCDNGTRLSAAYRFQICAFRILPATPNACTCMIPLKNAPVVFILGLGLVGP